jgi:hypothetical protein
MGSGNTKPGEHSTVEGDDTKNEVRKHMNDLKQLDSAIQNNILLELDRKMKEMMSEHETIHRDSEGNTVGMVRVEKISENKLHKVPAAETKPERMKRQLHRLTVKIHTARGLANTDRATGDPYVVAYIGKESEFKMMTTTVRNNVLSPFFGEDLMFHVDQVGVTDLETLDTIYVEVWDQDGRVANPVEGGRDDFLGGCTIPVRWKSAQPAQTGLNSNSTPQVLTAPSTSESFKLTGGASTKDSYIELSFTKKRENDDAHKRRASNRASSTGDLHAAAEKKTDDGTALRENIDKMDPADAERFCAAVLRMMTEKGPDGKSE